MVMPVTHSSRHECSLVNLLSLGYTFKCHEKLFTLAFSTLSPLLFLIKIRRGKQKQNPMSRLDGWVPLWVIAYIWQLNTNSSYEKGTCKTWFCSTRELQGCFCKVFHMVKEILRNLQVGGPIHSSHPSISLIRRIQLFGQCYQLDLISLIYEYIISTCIFWAV